MKAAWIVALLMVAGNAQAQAGDLRLGVTMASYHFFEAPSELGKFCQENLGLEGEYQLTDTVFISAGRYRNSVCDRSTFLALGKELESGQVFGVPVYTGIEIGVADGYEKLIEANQSVPTVGDYALMGGGFFRFSAQQHNVKLRYMVVVAGASYQYQF